MLKLPRWHDSASLLPLLTFENKVLCRICFGAISDKLFILEKAMSCTAFPLDRIPKARLIDLA